MNTVLRKTLAPLAAVLMLGSGAVVAGPVVIDGTDANDHGSVTGGGTNVSGWLYMESVLDNLGAALTTQGIPFAKTVTVLGMPAPAPLAPPTINAIEAQQAIQSAFDQSTLSAGGWTINYVGTGNANGTALNNLTLTGAGGTGILYLPTVGLTGGDMSIGDLVAEVNANATDIQAFVNSGGALFSMGETGTGAYGWLTTLLPGINVTNLGGGGSPTNITLTADGVAAFPGLTNTDLAGADPWHNFFSGNLGSLKVLGTATQGGATRNVIIGGGAGTVIVPVPEPGTLLLIGLGLMLLSTTARLRRVS